MEPAVHVTETSLLDELRAGRPVTYFTRGVSMRPLLRTAETHVHIRPLSTLSQEEWEKYMTRGIVLYQRTNGQLVLHRLIKQEGEVFYMRGDNTYGLEPIRREQLLGVVDLVWRNNAYIDVLSDRRYLRYVRRRIRNYPLRCVWRRLTSPPRRVLSRLLKRRPAGTVDPQG